MPDYDRLEQLTRLRDQGALTEDEFQQQKATVLDTSPKAASANGRPRCVIPLVLIAALIMIGVILYITQQAKYDIANVNSADGGRLATVLNGPDVNLMHSSGTVDTAKYGYSWATSEDVLGLNPVFIESKLGPAESKDSTSLSYHLAGCSIIFKISMTKVDSITTDVNNRCHPIVYNMRLTEDSTFGSISGYSTVGLNATCINESCGNAMEPSLTYFIPGAHVGNFVEYAFTSGSGFSDDAWVSSIKASHGIAPASGEIGDVELYSCVFNPDPPVAIYARNVKIEQVSFGHNLKDYCEYKS